MLRDHLHLGCPDLVKVIFDRRIYRNTPSAFATRVLRQGVVSCLKVFYKTSWLKQYNKGGRVLRTETCVNDPRDFMIKKSLVHLGYLGRVRVPCHHPLPESASCGSGHSLGPLHTGAARYSLHKRRAARPRASGRRASDDADPGGLRVRRAQFQSVLQCRVPRGPDRASRG